MSFQRVSFCNCCCHYRSPATTFLPLPPLSTLLFFVCSVVSYSLRPHELQRARLPCLSPTPGACSNSCPSSWWCHPTISSSVIPFSCLQSFSASGSFPMSQFFASGGQSIGASASASVLPVNIQDRFPLGLTIWSPCCPRDSEESSTARQLESVNSLEFSLLSSPFLTTVHDYWINHRLYRAF